MNLNYVAKFGQTLENEKKETNALREKFTMHEENLKTEVSELNGRIEEHREEKQSKNSQSFWKQNAGLLRRFENWSFFQK